MTPAAYATRLSKLSLAVRHILGDPDIIGLEEPENESVVADMAAKISADAIAAGEEDPKYVRTVREPITRLIATTWAASRWASW